MKAVCGCWQHWEKELDKIPTDVGSKLLILKEPVQQWQAIGCKLIFKECQVGQVIGSRRQGFNERILGVGIHDVLGLYVTVQVVEA
jgi:hypothetical protein